MKVFVAGATGAIGIPILRELAAGGHEAIGLTRSETKAGGIRDTGAVPAIGDVYDSARMKDLLTEHRPDAVIQSLNALPKGGPRSFSDLEETNRLRTEGTRSLLDAATANGVKRYVAENFIGTYGYVKPNLVTEDDPIMQTSKDQAIAPAIEAMASLETQIFEATKRGELEGVVLRCGGFYGPEVGATKVMVKLLRRRGLPQFGDGSNTFPWVHADDVSSAFVAALEKGHGGEAYNIVDDGGMNWREVLAELARATGSPNPWRLPRWVTRLGGSYAPRIFSTQLAVSNEKAKRELGWTPKYPTVREGFKTLV